MIKEERTQRLAGITDVQKRHRLQTDGCPDLIRLYDIFIKFDTMTDTEKIHRESDCSYCRLMKSMFENDPRSNESPFEYILRVRLLAGLTPEGEVQIAG